MPSTFLSIVVIVGLSLLVGRAIMLATGREKWNGLEPAVGFAGVMTSQGLLARIPGTHTVLVLGVVLLVAGSIFLIRRISLDDVPRSPFFWAAAVLTVAITSIPFAVTGHWGLLGMGYNNDLGLHLAWAEWLRSGFGTEPSDGYPLGPHGLATALSFIPKISLGPVFIGQVMAIAVLTVMTAWAALEKLGNWRRLLAALLVGLPYLMASYFVQGAFKELAAAMFLLAFVVCLPQVTPLPAGGRERLKATTPLIVLLLGIVFTYSFPGLAWPFAVLIIWVLADPSMRAKVAPRAILGYLARPVVLVTTLIVLGLLSALAFWGPFGFGDAFSEVATSGAFGPVSVIEEFGVWLTSDYRLAGDGSTPLPGLMAAIGLLALVVSLWWWRKQPRSVYPLAFIACAVLYGISLLWVGDYSLAKALVISAPITMVVILTALLSGLSRDWKPSQGMEYGAWITLTAVFVISAGASSLMVLRDASVSPPGRAKELDKFQPYVLGQTVLYGDQDRFAPYYLSGAKVGVPLTEFPDPDVIANERKPFQDESGMAAIDFDSFDEQTLQNFRYVITTAAGWTSKVPPFYEQVARTPSYILWQRADLAFGRPILNERTMAAKLVDCDNEGGKYYSTEVDGVASLMPEAVVGLRSDWLPNPDLNAGESASLDLELGKGRWRISIQYFSPAGFTLGAPGYRTRKMEASLDGQRLANIDIGSSGQFWPAGLLDVTSDGTTTFVAKSTSPSFLQRVTGYSRQTKMGRIVAMRTGPRTKVPMSGICDKWVDYFRRNESFKDDQRGSKDPVGPATGAKSNASPGTEPKAGSGSGSKNSG
ncbi:MAG: hypothetical protein JJE13_01715 [Thermoleophilia bacterium]|nr:hypothetical protein [Thermoleophilia bacterium]